MNRMFFSLVWCILIASIAFAKDRLNVSDLICKYKTNPIGIDILQPRLSWKLCSEQRNILQTAYEIQAAENPVNLESGKDLLWSTGKIDSDQSIHVVYTGTALNSRQRIYWQVRVWDNQGSNTYGEKCALLAQLEIFYRDGSRQFVITDNSWRASTGPIRASDIYHGETYDTRLEKAGWSQTGFDKHGNFYTDNLRAARHTIEYILKGNDIQVFEPHFTFQGFRFIAIDEWPGDPGLENFTGIVVHSDITPTGSFECSNQMINQLQHNIQWGQKGNFVDVPTDCPQRDERCGWTGDAQVFARTACFNADVAAIYTKWLRDVAVDQKPSGAVPRVVPNVLKRKDPAAEAASAGWADAAVIVPWTVYLCYGDHRILEQQYPSMKAWVDYMAGRAGNTYFWNTDFTFGDWLAFELLPNPGMNSFNHYAYGAIGEWLYRFVAGIEIDPAQPGYKHILIQPHYGAELSYAKASLNSMYGKISSAWKIHNEQFSLLVQIPPNATATVRLPDARLASVTESGKALLKIKSMSASQSGNEVMAEIGSGTYNFSYPLE